MTTPTPATRHQVPIERALREQLTGAEILSESWRLIRLTPWLFVLPFVVLLIGGIAESAVVTSLAHSLSKSSHNQITATFTVAVIVVGVAVAIPAVVVQAAGLIAIDATVDGRDAGPVTTLRALGGRAGSLFVWAVLSVMVNAVLRTAGRLIPFGSLAQISGEIGWGASTFLALPVMITERCGPITALRRSSRLLSKAWRPVLRSVARTWWRTLATIPLIVISGIGVAVIAGSQPGSGSERAGQLTVSIAVTLIFAVNLIFAGILTAARLTIYRHITGQSART